MVDSVVVLVGWLGGSDISVPVAAVDPSIAVDAPAPVRATAAFVVVVLLGGLLVRRRGAFLDRSVAALLDDPVWSVGYGVVAHLLIGFTGVYLTARLGQVQFSGVNASNLGLVVLVVLALSAGVVGFTVVGSAAVDVWGGGSDWAGPVVGGLVAGVLASLGLLVGGLGWLLVASVGIGGPMRRWVHAGYVDG